ncbi:hypothetical protein BHE74_00017512 [Ensete ventricosum]|nr:hypothetical protein GW17_00007970 [Ensete ventricosum]RWW74548.1 hypothetical protein BHE74_00017512 [Ensete ventricosum]
MTPRSRARRRGVASFSRWKTMRRLVPTREDEAVPRSPREEEAMPRPCTGRRGVASFSRWKTMRRLVRPLEDEAAPCPRAGRRTVPPSSEHSTYQCLVGPVCTARIGRYRSKPCYSWSATNTSQWLDRSGAVQYTIDVSWLDDKRDRIEMEMKMLAASSRQQRKRQGSGSGKRRRGSKRSRGGGGTGEGEEVVMVGRERRKNDKKSYNTY